MTKNDGGGHVDVIKRMLRSTTKTTEKESENEPQKEVYVQLSPTVPTITTSYGSLPYLSSIDSHYRHANVASRRCTPSCLTVRGNKTAPACQRIHEQTKQRRESTHTAPRHVTAPFQLHHHNTKPRGCSLCVLCVRESE